MNFRRSKFLNLLSNHQANLDKKAIDPIFSAIKLKIENGFLHIISTDSQRHLENIIPYNLENKSFYVNGLLLYEILKKSKNETFSIIEEQKNITKNDSYTILIDKAEFKISQTIRSINQDWSDININQITLKADILNNSLKNIKWAASIDESRPALTGVCFDFSKECLTLCSTDGLKLAITKIFDNFNFEGRWILGRKSINDLIKILDDCGSNLIRINFNKYFTLEYELDEQKTIWKSLFILDNFPPYQKILTIENQFNTNFEINAKEIGSIIDRIMIASNQNQPAIIFNFNKEKSTISSENSILTGSDILPIEYKGSQLKILLNGRFLQEMFSNITEDIIFFIKDPFSPIAIKSKLNVNTMFIIAPIKPNL